MKKIKEILDVGKIGSEEELLKKIDNYEYVSFDIFDTLLKRIVKEPSDVFRIMEEKLKRPGFYSARINAENIARNNTSAEVTINDIYDNFNTDQKKEYIDLEQSIEKDVLVCNPMMVNVYRKCIEKHKKVYIISDMYLPSTFLKEVLRNNGITQYEKLYVSCELGKTKAKGDLFDLYLEENNISPKNAVHIGDSWKSDYVNAKKSGISAVHIPRVIMGYETEKYKTRSEYMLQKFIKSTVENNKFDEYGTFGYQKFGPFLWGYVRWIHNQLKKEKIKKVYFFSRDGYIMMKAYQKLYPNNDVDVHYLEVSRRSLRIPTLWMDCSFDNMLTMVSPSKRIALASIFDCVGLCIDDYQNLLNKYKFDVKVTFDRNNIKHESELRKMYSELKEDIINNSKLEYGKLIQYLKQESVISKFAIVDIGWSGGMQRFLKKTLDTLNIKNNIYGYYIGIADYYTRNMSVPLNMRGYLFDFKNNANEIDKRSSFVGLFETLFLEQGGSVKNYSQKDNKIVAERYEYEYMKNGKPTSELTKVRAVQEGALRFIETIKKNNFLSKEYFTPDELYSGLRNTGQRPTRKDIQMFADFNFYDEGEDVKLANPKGLAFYIFHLGNLKNDFLSSRWKVGFLKRMFKFNLPYENIYTWLLRFK
ncbi:HAD family hydrolase [Ligilactobacillus equi]